MTGAELKAHRLRMGLSRRALAERADLSPSTVKYWERKPRVDVLGIGPGLLLYALGVRNGLAHVHTKCVRRSWLHTARSARTRYGVFPKTGSFNPRRVTCGAKTRKGTPCRAKSEPGKRRCRFHGGKSTGPKTPEGRARIAEAQRKRWANFRAKQEPKPRQKVGAFCFIGG